MAALQQRGRSYWLLQTQQWEVKTVVQLQNISSGNIDTI